MGDEAPSNDARLEAIRTHADQTMRYYATAFLREENAENREWMRAYMSSTANFVALSTGTGSMTVAGWRAETRSSRRI